MEKINWTPAEVNHRLASLYSPLGQPLTCGVRSKASFNMPSKNVKSKQQTTVEEGATGGDLEHGFQSEIIPDSSVEDSFSTLAQLFEGFMQLQSDRDWRQEKETEAEVQCLQPSNHSTPIELGGCQVCQSTLVDWGIAKGRAKYVKVRRLWWHWTHPYHFWETGSGI